MQTVVVSYQTGLRTKKFEFDVPEKWDEMTAKQIFLYLKFIGKYENNYDLKVAFAHYGLHKLPLFRINRLKEQYEKFGDTKDGEDAFEAFLDNSFNLSKLIDLLGFMDTPLEFTKNYLPRIKHLYGPSDGMRNLTIWEFAVAEHKLEQFYADEDEEILNELVAILYRPANPFKLFLKLFTHVEDVRISFNDATFKNRVKAISKINIEKRTFVATMFRTVRNSFETIFPNVYSQVGTKETDTSEKSTWSDVIISMSGDIPGNEEKVGKVNLYTFLYRMEMNMREAKKLKQ